MYIVEFSIIYRFTSITKEIDSLMIRYFNLYHINSINLCLWELTDYFIAIIGSILPFKQ